LVFFRALSSKGVNLQREKERKDGKGKRDKSHHSTDNLPTQWASFAVATLFKTHASLLGYMPAEHT
jgi:hypothetical protein